MSTYPPRSRQKESGLTTFELEHLPSLPSSFVDSNPKASSTRGDIELKPLPSSANDSQTILRITTRSSNARLSTTNQDDDDQDISPELRKRYKRNDLIQFCALCWLVFLVGWNDGTTGPLIPRMQVDYKLDYLIVSLLFVATAMGHIVGAAANIWLNDRFGFGKVLVFGACVQTLGYVIMCPTPPFPAFAFASGLTGFGISLANGQANGFLGSLKKNMHTKLGIYHGCYGLGAFLAPFVSTVFSTQHRWTFHYLTSAGMQLTNIAALILVFKFRRQEEILADAGQLPSDDATALNANDNKFKSMIKQPAVHLLAAFCLIYVGIEVSLGGWIVTFIIRERSGGPSSGYISSGFFGGLALGRVALIGVNRWIGEERVVYIYTVLAIVLELTIWFVPSIIQNAIAVSIIGLLLGPFFPIIVSHSSRILPHWMLTACVGWIAGIGVSGSAVLPFITGILASRFGIKSLQPLMVSMMGGMVLMWLWVPKVNRRID